MLGQRRSTKTLPRYAPLQAMLTCKMSSISPLFEADGCELAVLVGIRNLRLGSAYVAPVLGEKGEKLCTQ